MKIKIDVDNEIKESEIIIKCSEINDEIKTVQNILNKINEFMSCVNEKNSSNQIKTNTLILAGNCSFSGIEIFYI